MIERKALEEELAAMAPPANVVRLHPGAAKRYLEIVNDLATSLSRRNVAIGDAPPEPSSAKNCTMSRTSDALTKRHKAASS
jgi:hypothetical protein